MNEPCFGTCGRDEVKKGGGGKSVKKAPAKREISILKTWRGRAWDTSECSDAQHPKFKLGSVVSDYRYRPRVFGSNRILRATGAGLVTNDCSRLKTIAPDDSWQVPVARHDRLLPKTRGRHRESETTEPSLNFGCCASEYSEVSHARPRHVFNIPVSRFAGAFSPLFPPAPSVSLDLNSDFRLKPGLPLSLTLTPTFYWWF